MNRPRGFTLVELMVVVTIIVMLLAMLSPAIDRVVQAAERARCLAQVKGQMTAITSYALENSRVFAPVGGDMHSPDFQRSWSAPDAVTLMRDKYLPRAIMLCPLLNTLPGFSNGYGDGVGSGWGGWDTDEPRIYTAYMWMAGFSVQMAGATMYNDEPVPPLTLGKSSARHAWITHRLSFYSATSVHETFHGGRGKGQASSPYYSFQGTDMSIGLGDGSAANRTRDDFRQCMSNDKGDEYHW